MTRSILTLLSVFVLSAFATIARAQADDAAAAFARGQAAVLEYDYARALESFEEAQRIAPHDAVRFNIAVCLEYLGRYREAWLQYLGAVESSQLDDAARTEARASAARLRDRLGTIAIVEPIGARISVDGEERCTAPCEAESDPGDRVIVAEGDAGRGQSRVTVERGERHEVRLALAAIESDAPIEGASTRRGVGWLLGVGGAIAAVGVGGVIGFGVHTQALHDAYQAMPPPASQSTYDEGVLMQALTNGSIVVASVGAALVVLDLLLAAGGSGTELAREGGVIRF